MAEFHIESRVSAHFSWRKVTARPHGERYPFDPHTRVLKFESRAQAEAAVDDMRRANGGEFRKVETIGTWKAARLGSGLELDR